MNLLIDTDVVLDLLLKRQPFFTDAVTLWQAADQGRFERYVAAITPINVFYIARKANGAAAAHRVIDELLAVVRVAPVDAAILQAASSSGFADFEDAVQIAAAQAIGVDAIVTRNLADYAGAQLPTYAPADILRRLPPL
jgi:predicted nucleic acid-binding protein